MTQNWNLENLRSPQNPWRSPATLGIISALAAIGVSVYTVKTLQESSFQKLQASIPISPVVKTVTALGRLEPKEEVIKLTSPSSMEGNRIQELLVKEGDRVQAKEVVAIMDSRERLQASLGEAEKQVQVAQSRLAQVKAGAKQGEISAKQAIVKRLQAELQGNISTLQTTINRLEAELQGQQQQLKATVSRLSAEKRYAQADVYRYETLYKQGAISNQEVDRRRLSADTSTQQVIESQATKTRTIATLKAQINEAQANRQKTIATLKAQINEAEATLKQTSEVRPTDIANAQAEVDSAQATVKRIQVQLDQAYIRAPKTGQILKINTRAGEIPGNEGILLLGQTDQMYAVAEVYQSNVNQVVPGQTVKVSSEAIGGELQGTVDWIGMQVQRQNIINSDPSSNLDTRIVEVHVRLDQPSSQKASKFTNLQIKAVINL